MGISLLFFLLSSLTFDSDPEIIFSPEVLTSQDYLNSANQWTISNNTDGSLYAEAGGLLLKSDGDPYLVYPIQFNYKKFDQLTITFYADKLVKLTIIPNVSTTGFGTFELVKEIKASDQFKETKISLHLPFFKDYINDLGVRLSSEQSANIVIQEISLKKMNPVELLVHGAKDYFRVAPYSGFTANLFPTPRVFGRSAMVYALPLILILIFIILYKKRFRKIAFLLLLVIWVLTDIRMSYESLAHNAADYKSFVQPSENERSLRTYDDFYQFSDWVQQNLVNNDINVNFYSSGSSHFPRLLQYLAYPLVIEPESQRAETYIIYNRSDITYNQADSRLYIGQELLSQAGEVVVNYNKNSFIFKETSNEF